jgi:hypothetical protein
MSALSLEDEFVSTEKQLLENLERYKELCDRMGFNFSEHIDDLMNQTEGQY